MPGRREFLVGAIAFGLTEKASAAALSGGAADKAGLKKGDAAASFNGRPITDSTDLTAQVRTLAPGSTAKLVYVRGDASTTVTVTLGTLNL